MSAFADQAHTLSEKRSGNDDPYPQVRQAHEEAPWLLANPSEPFGEPGVDFGRKRSANVILPMPASPETKMSCR